MMQNYADRAERPTTLKHRSLIGFSDLKTAEHSTLSTKSASGKTKKPNSATWTLKAEISQQMSLDFDDSSL